MSPGRKYGGGGEMGREGGWTKVKVKVNVNVGYKHYSNNNNNNNNSETQRGKRQVRKWGYIDTLYRIKYITWLLLLQINQLQLTRINNNNNTRRYNKQYNTTTTTQLQTILHNTRQHKTTQQDTLMHSLKKQNKEIHLL